MMGHSHAASGAVLGLAAVPLLAELGAPTSARQLVSFVIVCAVAALWPDVDCQGSTISRAVFPVPWPWLRGWVWHAVVIPLTGGHRHRTHTLAFAAGSGALAQVAGGYLHAWWLGLSVGLGCLAHLAGDCCTDHGCPLLLPLSRRRFTLDLFSTNGIVEHAVVMPVLAVLGWWLFERAF